ncbi:MAG: hypothetical protein LIO39_03835, partial [Lachnospiraceae bacterium]|nr:hypothetical protein [Lachnospiraceae bacterium]
MGRTKMSKETEQNIRRLEAMLPKEKGKVVAVLWMTVLSAVLLVGSTFAWVTLSTNPEVSGVTTTVSGNGSLEIALSGAEGNEPETSEVGDSSAVQGETASNLTWGNLVSLSDSSYGLDDLVLYPSKLNSSQLASSPLSSVYYGTDGRITSLNTALRYTTWDENYEFWKKTGNYGVRAVAALETTSTGATDLQTLEQAAQTKLIQAEDAYAAVVSSGSGYMSNLVAIIGDYMDYKINGGDEHDYAAYTGDIYNMYVDLSAALDRLGEAYVAIAEIYQYGIYGATEGVKNYAPYTLTALETKTEADWAELGITLTGWDDYLALKQSIEENTEEILAIHNKGLAGNSVSWAEIKPYLNDLFPYADETTTYTYKGGSSDRVYHWDDFSGENATVVIMWFLCTDSDSEETRAKNTCYVQMGSGLLYDFEELIDYSMTTDKLEAHFTHPTFYGWDLWIQMVVSTTSANNYASDAIAAAPDDTDAGGGSTAASETYGMAVDLWVRTNAEGTSYLLLDGALVTDDSGNVTGYEGSNRIWEEYDDETVFGTSTTQGSGSCYTFSYDSAEELTQILNMLENMKVVFFHTTNGTKLATASFDVTNYYESSGGCVTVPLRADSGDGNSITMTDEDGDATTVYYITKLTQNDAMPITALLYLDGTQITNADASVSENFTGELNIQFASSANLETSGSTSGDLYSDTVDLSAAAEYTTDNDGNVTAAVTLTVSSGTIPTAVSAGYSRQMNNGSQALRADAVEFTLSESTEGESTWTMEYTFSAAGTYVLSIVTVDGKKYELEEPLTVTVEGFALDAVRWDYSSSTYSVLTADSSVTVPVTLDFAVDYTGNQNVRAAYVSSDGKYIYASLTVDEDDASVWKGQAQFTSSGTYTLKYFYIGNDIYDIPEAMQKTLTVSMGLRASVRLTCTSFEEGQTSIVYEDGDTYTVNVAVTLTDNAGSTLRNITGSGGIAEGSTIKLRYTRSDSATEYLETTLTWDSSSSSYTGSFSVSTTGVYSFTAVTIGSESVTSTTSAPSLSVHYDEGTVPEYAENLTTATQTVIGGTGSFVVRMANSSSSWKIKAVVKDTDVIGTDVTYT